MDTVGKSWRWPDQVFIFFTTECSAFCKDLDALGRSDEDEIFPLELWMPFELADFIASVDSFRTDRRGMRCSF